ncbi:MAG: iron-containing alcohol dehydrogenase [Bacteroidales bacterium]|nr:iron-containing alcohol dehydrogenase [Bacteroidales bacterium]
MTKFVFQSTPKLIFGENSVDLLTEEMLGLQVANAFFICDPVIKTLSFWDKITKELQKKDFKYSVFDSIISDPDYDIADAATKEALKTNCDIIIGVGGGSALDIAKIVSISSVTGESCKELMNKKDIAQKGCPLILIPTTAGTGSEVTHISILSDNKEQTKNGLVSPKLYADIAILDPIITLSLPPNITAFSGLDAIIHALEALTSRLANPFTDILAFEALKVLYDNILDAFNDGQDIDARTQMLYGSMLAGKAFANSSVGAIHAFAYPIGAEYHIPHGLANSIMLTPVLRFNLSATPDKYAKAARAIGIDTLGITNLAASELLLTKLDKLVDELKISRFLRFYGVSKSDIPRLSEKVMKITRLLNNNPQKISLKDAENLYLEAL